MDKLKEAIKRADRVQLLIESEDIQGAFADIEREIIALWDSSASGDEGLREQCYRELRGVRALKVRLRRILNEGLLAREELEHRNRNNG